MESGDLYARQAHVVDKDLGTDPVQGHLRAVIGGPTLTAFIIVAFAIVSAFTDLAGLRGSGIASS